MRIVGEVVIAIGSSFVLLLIVKASVISGGAFIASHIAHRSRASVRHLLLATAFIVLLALPVVSMIVPGGQLGITIPQPAQTVVVAPAPGNTSISVSASGFIGGLAGVHQTGPWPSASTLLLVVWFGGGAVFLVFMTAGLLRVHRIRQNGLPWREGQAVVSEIAAVQTTRTRIQLLLDEAVTGPMTCGVFRPVIVLPRDARQWRPEELRRAIIHELEHIKRMDWLMLCIARAACAFYWFHPLVWMCWRRLRLEAERACDDAVLCSADPGAYADQLVTAAERLAANRASSVLAMANRSDLSARVAAVLDSTQPRGRAGSRWTATVSMAAVLLIAGIAPLRVVAVPQNAAGRGAVRIAFEVASIRPNAQGFIDLGGGFRLLSGRTRCQATDTPLVPGDPLPSPGLGRCAVRNSTVKEMIDVAYGLRSGPVRAVLNQMIIGGPAWVETAIFDIDAKTEDPYATTQQMQAMFRTLLAERFKLTFHREARQMTGLALVVSNSGHKLKEGDRKAKPGFVAAPAVRGENVPVVTIANFVSQRLGRMVIDDTGLTSVYNFTLSWTPDPTELGPNGTPVRARLEDQAHPSLVTALQEQLGLRLETRQAAVEVFVIDSVEIPTPN